MASVLKNGFIMPLAVLETLYGAENVDKILREKLILVDTPRFGPAVSVVLFKKALIGEIRCIYVPRLWLSTLCYKHALVDPPKILFTPRQTINVLEFTGESDHNQVEVINALLRDHLSEERISTGRGAALLRLEAGRGKTFVAAALIGRLKLRTLYIVTKRPLQSQAVADLRKVMRGNIAEFSTAAARAGKLPDVAVVVIDTAVKLPPDVLSKFQFVIYDEVQKLRSACRREIFRKTMTWVNLGMTATPHRQFDDIYKKELALGDETPGVVDRLLIADALPGYRSDDVIFDIHIRVIHYYGPDEYTKNISGATGSLSALHMQKQFISDPYRMRLIASELSKLINWEENGKKHGVYIFCEERDQLEVVYAALCNEYTIDVPELEKSVGRFHGKAKKKDIKEMASRARIYLTTYGFSSEGISNCQMTAEIFCTTRRNNMEQIMGRILRRNGDPAVPRYIVDIIDERTAMKHQFNTRKIDYDKREGVTYEHHRVEYTDV